MERVRAQTRPERTPVQSWRFSCGAERLTCVACILLTVGYHLALELAGDKGMDITILHEGPNKGKAPHNAYGDLDAAGVKVIWCDSLDDSAACIEKLGDAKFNAVVDNWSKSPEQIKPYAELAQSMDVTNYCYISSAGMYKPETDAIVTEECACKTTGAPVVRIEHPA